MEDLRTKSCGDGRVQMEVCYDGGGRKSAASNGVQDLRCYSFSYAQQQQLPPHLPQEQAQPHPGSNDAKFKKGSGLDRSVSKSWSFGDPELRRKTRIVSYKAYAVEGKMKGSLRKSFRWLRSKCADLVHGPR